MASLTPNEDAVRALDIPGRTAAALANSTAAEIAIVATISEAVALGLARAEDLAAPAHVTVQALAVAFGNALALVAHSHAHDGRSQALLSLLTNQVFMIARGKLDAQGLGSDQFREVPRTPMARA